MNRRDLFKAVLSLPALALLPAVLLDDEPFDASIDIEPYPRVSVPETEYGEVVRVWTNYLGELAGSLVPRIVTIEAVDRSRELPLIRLRMNKLLPWDWILMPDSRFLVKQDNLLLCSDDPDIEALALVQYGRYLEMVSSHHSPLAAFIPHEGSSL